jgi:hypothetical protein
MITLCCNGWPAGVASSHYCDKARWALDLSPLANSYVEDCHAPGLHFPVVERTLQAAAQARGEKVSRLHGSPTQKPRPHTSIPAHVSGTLLMPHAHGGWCGAPCVQWSAEGMLTGTPLLVYEDGRTYHDSSLILEHLAHAYPQQLGHLYPNDDTQKREEVRRE